MQNREIKTLLIGSILSIIAGCSPLSIASEIGKQAGAIALQDGSFEQKFADRSLRFQINAAYVQIDRELFIDVSVLAHQGRVLLVGAVNSHDDRIEAVKLAYGVEGVKEVINELIIDPGFSILDTIKDELIETKLNTEMAFNQHIKSLNYSNISVNGVLYLFGTPRSDEEKAEMIKIARIISGVRQIINHLVVHEQPPEAEA